ncbi:hypothetical protein AB4156_32390 [Cupriavidus sp. 2MCAB6]|uniref:hypothetical protein n=1 Tax=Cupriavidus sp. 2MCAB6 TaxID=3232981 RepID=UPI003F929268
MKKTYITSIEDLQRKPTGELWVIFREATQSSHETECSESDRKAARESAANIRAILRQRAIRPGPGRSGPH